MNQISTGWYVYWLLMMNIYRLVLIEKGLSRRVHIIHKCFVLRCEVSYFCVLINQWRICDIYVNFVSHGANSKLVCMCLSADYSTFSLNLAVEVMILWFSG